PNALTAALFSATARGLHDQVGARHAEASESPRHDLESKSSCPPDTESKNLLAVGFFLHFQCECCYPPAPARTRTLEISNLPPKAWLAVHMASALLIPASSPDITQRQSFAIYRTQLVRYHASH